MLKLCEAKKCVSYMGWFEGIGPSQLQNTAAKDRTVPSQWESRIPKMVIWIKYITGQYPPIRSDIIFISRICQGSFWNSQQWFRTVLTPFPTFCFCDWPNFPKPSYITNTFSSTISLQHPLEPVQFPEVEGSMFL
jgi:hypothetical protein